jgi:hypothetical protein
LVPHNKKVVGNTWDGVGKCVWRTLCIRFSTIQLRRFVEGCNCFSRNKCTLRCIKNNLSQITWYFSPPTLRMKCRMLNIGKCIWSGCHGITLPELQANWISASVMYIWKNTQVREFRSMLIPELGFPVMVIIVGCEAQWTPFPWSIESNT